MVRKRNYKGKRNTKWAKVVIQVPNIIFKVIEISAFPPFAIQLLLEF